MIEITTRSDMSTNARLIDNLDALSSWAMRSGFNEDEPDSSVVMIPGGDEQGFWIEFADILESFQMDIRSLI